MARPREELQEVLESLPGEFDVYFQAPTEMKYPCILYEPSKGSDKYGDNIKYWTKKGYTVTIIDRDPDSLIPGLVDGLRHASFDRFFRVEGLNHFVFQLYF